MNEEYEMEYTREDELLERISELEKELKAEKEYSATLRKEIDEFTNSHTLCAKYKELEKELKEIKNSDSVTELKFLRNASKAATRDVINAYANGKAIGEYNILFLQNKIDSLEKESAELKELLKEAIQLLKNSDELYSYQIRDFQLKCDPFIKGE